MDTELVLFIPAARTAALPLEQNHLARLSPVLNAVAAAPRGLQQALSMAWNRKAKSNWDAAGSAGVFPGRAAGKRAGAAPGAPDERAGRRLGTRGGGRG